MAKVFISGGERYQESKLLIAYGHTVVKEITDCDIVLFTGGADVSPELYNHPKHRSTYPNEQRDLTDTLNYQAGVAMNKIMFGICRGAQFLCVQAGGSLIQDCSNHGIDHNVVMVESGEIIPVTSAHHQMLVPPEGAIMLATSPEEVRVIKTEGATFVETRMCHTPEIMMFPNINALAVQGHPEFSLYNKRYDRFRDVVMDMLSTMLPDPSQPSC